jgi:hypothetical protein
MIAVLGMLVGVTGVGERLQQQRRVFKRVPKTGLQGG